MHIPVDAALMGIAAIVTSVSNLIPMLRADLIRTARAPYGPVVR